MYYITVFVHAHVYSLNMYIILYIFLHCTCICTCYCISVHFNPTLLYSSPLLLSPLFPLSSSSSLLPSLSPPPLPSSPFLYLLCSLPPPLTVSWEFGGHSTGVCGHKGTAAATSEGAEMCDWSHRRLGGLPSTIVPLTRTHTLLSLSLSLTLSLSSFYFTLSLTLFHSIFHSFFSQSCM